MSDQSPNWKNELGQWLRETVSSVDDFIDIRWRAMENRFGWDGIPRIQPYIGFANDRNVWVHGRVLTNPPAALPEEDEKWWENLANTYRRFASDEVPGCKVEARFGNVARTAQSDKEGYFNVRAEHRFPDSARGLWSAASVSIVEHPSIAPEDSTVSAKILTPSALAKFGVISDIDDTVMHTQATQVLTMAKLTFLGNARTRVPLAGVAAFYRALQGLSPTRGPMSENLNPIFYVSSSAWNLFDLLQDFFELNGIPLGPILLRDLGFDSNKFIKEGHDHKLDKVRRIFAAYPNLPFVLIGDSGQEDAQLYARAAEEFGDRIALILIRDVDPGAATHRDEDVGVAISRAEKKGVPMHLIEDSAKGAEIAINLDLLPKETYRSIEEAVAADRGRD